MDVIHNERIKLLATYLNGVAIAVFAVGGLAPAFAIVYGTASGQRLAFTTASSAGCLVGSAAIHYATSLVLRRLRA